ncbi:MAG: hypothetical protein U9Q03_06070 [Patescibacteria group bacterium]|nr:hypothetical protein [Patescibacteria group bacterium]
MATKFVAVDLVGSVLYYPIWWYTGGTLRAARFCGGTVAGVAIALGWSVWVKNLFVPMFGQRDIASRLISFFMRLVTIVFYSVLLLLLIVVMFAVFLLWLLLPPFVIYEFGNQLLGLLSS